VDELEPPTMKWCGLLPQSITLASILYENNVNFQDPDVADIEDGMEIGSDGHTDKETAKEHDVDRSFYDYNCCLLLWLMMLYCYIVVL
jgi:hypothetical protein